MNGKWIPGPWTVRCDTVFGPASRPIADIRKWNDTVSAEVFAESGANAHLIAAAPELVEALGYAAEIIKTARGYFPKSIRHRDAFALENTNAAINKALAKARGE